jgi:GNAT superfamily N-acetyltransferase
VALRGFRDADAVAVHALIHRTIDACYPAVYPPRAVDFFKRFHSLEAVSNRASAGHVVVVDDGSGIVATGARTGHEISGVFVAPEAQGRGLGALVMDALESGVLAAGNPVARLDVSLPSRGFYERRGYVVLANRSIDVGDGQHLLYWEAEKSLGA